MTETQKTGNAIYPDSIKVAEIMHEEVLTLQVDLPIDDAIDLFEDRGISGAPVVDANGILRGVITSSDLLVASEETPPSERKAAVIGGWMTPEVVTVEHDATLGEVCDALYHETIHRIFVTRNGKVVGVVAGSDIVRCIAQASSAWSGEEC